MSTLQISNGNVRLDALDTSWAQGRAWYISDTGYAKCYSRQTKRRQLRMHRLVMERTLGRALTSSEFVDHINGDKLDNRRSNLRLATKSQNGMNRGKPSNGNTRHVGVHLDASRDRYMVYINANGERFYLGRYRSEDEAAWMYDQWAIALHGEFARLNLEYV